MGILDMVRGRENTVQVSDLTATENHQPKETSPENPPQYTSDSDGRLSLDERNEKDIWEHPNEVNTSAQAGVQKAEAAALVWSKQAVYGTYAWIWVSFFMLALQSAIAGNISTYAYSNFKSAPQVATATILASVVGGVLKLVAAKVLNLWGRAEGLAVSVFIYVLGMIVLAACNGPNGYAAGYTLFYVGYDAIYLILQIFIADTSGLRNRAFAFAFANTPFICTAFTASLAANSFIKTSGWRWAYGTFTIVMPFVFLPLGFVFKMYEKKAEKMGLYRHVPSGRTITQSLVHYWHEFDVLGALILMAGWILLLLPFSLETAGRSEYKSATFIAMIVVGFFVLIGFGLWEKFFARKHFVNYELLKKRTVLGACITSALTYFSFYCWDTYFQSFLMVVYNLDVSMSGYMLQIYNVGSCFWGVVVGLWMRFTKEFKWTCLCFGLPLLLLGSGLMIHFRGTDNHDDLGYVIMCQIFIAFGGGTLIIGDEMAVMSAADREGVPMMLALIGLFSSFGGAIGSAVMSAIYTNTFPDALEDALPANMKSNATQIYNAGYLTQVTYDMGSPARDAASYAWGYSQKCGAIASTAILAACIPAIFIWKNYRLDKKQNKGTML